MNRTKKVVNRTENYSLNGFFVERLRAYVAANGLNKSRTLYEWCAPELANVDAKFGKWFEAETMKKELEK